jgi:hypothetical protein
MHGEDWRWREGPSVLVLGACALVRGIVRVSARPFFVPRNELGLEHHVPHPRSGWPRSTTIHMPRSNAPRDGSGKLASCAPRSRACRRIHGGRYHRRERGHDAEQWALTEDLEFKQAEQIVSRLQTSSIGIARDSRRPILGQPCPRTPTSQGPSVPEGAVATHRHLRQERMTSVQGHVPGLNSGQPHAPALS